MPDQDNENDVVNLKELKEIMDDDMELIQDCFNDFVQDWPSLYVLMKSAIIEKDAKQLDESAHKLKGTLRYLAADAAANAAYVLESAGKDNDLDGIDEKLKTLKDECQKLVGYISKFTP